MTINIPPLRDREGDAIIIATALLKKFSDTYKKAIKGFSREAAQAIETYEWPGNIRQLENKIKRAVIMADEATINLKDLEMANPGQQSLPLNLKEVREAAETLAIKRALTYCDNNISKAAQLLGVTRPTLYTLFDKYGIEV